MSEQIGLFDQAEANRRKVAALDQLEEHHEDWLYFARLEAVRIARIKGTVTADDVRAELYRRGITPKHHNAWGAVFRDKRLVWTGKFRKSALPQGKGNMQRVWRLAIEEAA
jgi:hypothetical protein